MSYLLEGVPVFLALLAVAHCLKALLITADKSLIRVNSMRILAASIMIVAQLNWAWTYLIKGDVLSTDWVDQLWTVFNALVMVIFIDSARQQK